MKTNSCKNCKFYKRIYRRSEARFFPFNEFYCTAREKATDGKVGCSLWQKRAHDYCISPQRLKEVEEDIKFLLEHLV